jgi:hypothetical protein
MIKSAFSPLPSARMMTSGKALPAFGQAVSTAHKLAGPTGLEHHLFGQDNFAITTTNASGANQPTDQVYRVQRNPIPRFFNQFLAQQLRDSRQSQPSWFDLDPKTGSWEPAGNINVGRDILRTTSEQPFWSVVEYDSSKQHAPVHTIMVRYPDGKLRAVSTNPSHQPRPLVQGRLKDWVNVIPRIVSSGRFKQKALPVISFEPSAPPASSMPIPTKPSKKPGRRRR